MEQYCMLAVTVILCVIGCHGQYGTTEPLHARVAQLENTILELLTKMEEMRTTKTVPSSTETQPLQKRGFMYGPEMIFADSPQTIPPPEIGFSLKLTNNMELTYGDKLMFNKVTENIGGAYNTEIGEFVAPVAGTYLFSLNIACMKGTYIEMSVEVNNGSGIPRYILNAVCDHRKRTPANGSSLYCGETQNGGTAIVRLNVGDRVSVKKLWPLVRFEIGTLLGKGLTTFSGYLLRAA